MYQIGQQDGRLTKIGTVRTENGSRALQSRMHPDANLIFILADAWRHSEMHVFLRSNNAIQPVIGSPFPLRPDAKSFAFTPDGRFVLVVHRDSHQIAVYAIDDIGGIHPTMGSPYETATNPERIEVDPGGMFAYVTYPDNGTVAVFSLDPQTGALKPVLGSTTRAALHPRIAVTVVPQPAPDTAVLPSPDSPSLLAIDTAAPGATSEPEKEVARLDAPAKPEIRPLQLFCSVQRPRFEDPTVSNLEKITVYAGLNGDQSLRPRMLRARRYAQTGDRDDTIELKVTQLDVNSYPTDVDFEILSQSVRNDSIATGIVTSIHVLPAQAYVDKSIDEYLKRAGLKQDRGAEALARKQFFENRTGLFEIGCRYEPPTGGSSAALSAKTTMRILSHGGFFDQPAWRR
jgi:hypothetical protein